jgi:hypothetical protein
VICHVHLKDQNSINKGHKANLTFSLMDNQSKNLKTQEALSQIPKVFNG